MKSSDKKKQQKNNKKGPLLHVRGKQRLRIDDGISFLSVIHAIIWNATAAVAHELYTTTATNTATTTTAVRTVLMYTAFTLLL